MCVLLFLFSLSFLSYSSLFQREPADRPTCAELLCHPFLTKACEMTELIPLVEVVKEEKKNSYLDDEEEEEEGW